jgi:hypothetical protein
MNDAGAEDVVSIRHNFKDLGDPRSTINRKDLLGDLIVISALAVSQGVTLVESHRSGLYHPRCAAQSTTQHH